MRPTRRGVGLLWDCGEMTSRIDKDATMLMQPGAVPEGRGGLSSASLRARQQRYILRQIVGVLANGEGKMIIGA